MIKYKAARSFLLLKNYSINITFTALRVIMKKILFVSVILFGFGLLSAQEFDKEQQYQQALQNAKAAFEANQYSQAVLFYREAQQIKPEALLPKYKIEDIRTIYIEKELNALPKPEPAKKMNRKERQQQEIEVQQNEEKARVEATKKMNEDAEVAREEMEQLKVAVIDIPDDEPEEISDSLHIESLAGNREVVLNQVTQKDHQSLSGGIKNQRQQDLTVQKRTINDVPATPEDTVIETSKPKPEPKKVVVNTPVKESVSPQTMTEEERKVWIVQETQKLKEKYPNQKTVEEIDLKGKHITRVIMHIDNKVAIYLKVKHSWGATFFFIDEVGQDLRSINEQYFNLMTNLNTYGN